MLSKRTAHAPSDPFSRYRATKASAVRSRRTRDSSSSGGSRRPALERRRRPERPGGLECPPDGLTPSSPIVMLRVGPGQRLFAAHEAILTTSPFFAAQCAAQPISPPSRAHPIPHPTKQIDLPDEQPEVLSCVLEFLYKGDYYPRLRHNSQRRTWELEDAALDAERLSPGATIWHHAVGDVVLRDTAVYCAAHKYALPTLQRLALRKQGLHTGIQCATILASARYAYAHTPDSESRLRAHYLAMIIRCRGTFKRSGTMQMEMERGGRLFFDLFVAMCNHMVSPRLPPSTGVPYVFVGFRARFERGVGN
ncbi:hypothetical protein N7462_007378 [Penicillium macrosclerotiorum]|uniref:uncharacterized protein n=1 Tax=Penicillium macrosclerotiorum TaxID=303699 RepID=UPI0025478BF7|nr:uncharacterized protein N7462_007378 [Penicillium macrosclerotiorum]KAJ5679134.1 hypothetical protein N7462_007378 [Penicillium macrosclerotiorum]